MAKKRMKLYKVGTISKGKFRNKMQQGTGFRTKRRAETAKRFYQRYSRKKIVIRRR